MNNQSYEQLMQELMNQQAQENQPQTISVKITDTEIISDQPIKSQHMFKQFIEGEGDKDEEEEEVLRYSSLPTSTKEIREELSEKIRELVASKQVQSMAQAVNLEANVMTDAILAIGGDVMLKLDEVANVLMEHVQEVPLEDSEMLIHKLENIMVQVDIEKILADAEQVKEEPSKIGRLSKLTKRLTGATSVEDVLRKYQALSRDFDLITTGYTKMIKGLNQSNLTLGSQIKAAEVFYTQMDLHIAVLYALKERIILSEIPKLQQALQKTGEPMLEYKIQTMMVALQLTDQRLTELMISQQSVFQSIPMIKNAIVCNIQLTHGFKTALQSVPVLKSNIISAIEINRSVIAANTLAKAQQIRDQQLQLMGIATVKQAEMTVKTMNNSTGTAKILKESVQKVNEAQKILVTGIKQSFDTNEQARTQMMDTKVHLVRNSRKRMNELMALTKKQR